MHELVIMAMKIAFVKVTVLSKGLKQMVRNVHLLILLPFRKMNTCRFDGHWKKMAGSFQEKHVHR